MWISFQTEEFMRRQVLEAFYISALHFLIGIV